MRNYPEIIRNLKLGSNYDKIADSLDKNGFILHGNVDLENDVVTFYYSNGKEKKLPNVKHNGIYYLPSCLKKEMCKLNEELSIPLEESIRDNNLSRVSSITIGSLFLVGNYPLLTSLWYGYTIVKCFYDVRYNNLKELLDLDYFFGINEDQVKELLNDNLDYLSSSSKEIFTQDNRTITLNNIEKYHNSELLSIKKEITDRQNKKINQKRKRFKRLGKYDT